VLLEADAGIDHAPGRAESLDQPPRFRLAAGARVLTATLLDLANK